MVVDQVEVGSVGVVGGVGVGEVVLDAGEVVNPHNHGPITL